MAMAFLSFGLAFALPCQAETTEDKEAAALLTDAKKSFKQHVEPFVKNYCVECHGNRRSKSGVNFEVAVQKPGACY